MADAETMLNGPDERSRSTRRPRIRLPAGYDNDAQFLDEMRTLFYEDSQADLPNRLAGLEDLQFVIGEQWNADVKARRDAARKPTLTINRLPAYVAQVVGARRLNETSIRIVPDNGGTKQIAKIREGLLRSIQKHSRAKLAYDTALAGAVMCGIGNFQICLDHATNDIWSRDIAIHALQDHLAVVWDRNMTDPTGRDASRCFVVDTLSKRDFEREYPWATPSDMMADVLVRNNAASAGWVGIEDIRVVNYWRMRSKKRLFAMLNDGTTTDITDIDLDTPEGASVFARIVLDREGEPLIRQVSVKYAQMYVCSGLDVLEGPHDYPIDRVPVFRVPGYELKIGDWKHRWGVIRHAKDPQRLHNYWRSAVAEKLMQTPRGVWVAADTSVQGREDEWRNSHLSDDPLLVWNAESGAPPNRIPPAQVEDALLAQAMITTQDIKDVTNIHEAALGMPSNEVSGAAIKARRAVTDIGTAVYHDNLNSAIEEAGRVANDLIPVVYDSIRTIKVIGEDDEEVVQLINAMDDPTSVDITSGKYAVTAITGPSHETKRIEQADFITKAVTAAPQVMSVAGDLLFEYQDVAGADKLATRLRNNMPGVVFAPDEMTPEMQQRAAGQQQQQSVVAQAALAKEAAELRAKDSQTALNMARARNFMVQADVNPQKVDTQTANTASQIADRRVRAELEAVRVFSGS